jgi:hypothetical protein
MDERKSWEYLETYRQHLEELGIPAHVSLEYERVEPSELEKRLETDVERRRALKKMSSCTHVSATVHRLIHHIERGIRWGTKRCITWCTGEGISCSFTASAQSGAGSLL